MAFLVTSAVLSSGGVQYPPAPEIVRGDVAVVLENWARVPLSSTTPSRYPPPINYRDALSRVSVMRFEPGGMPVGATRMFVGDLNRSLAILDVSSRSFLTYINFEEVFPKFVNRTSLGTGFVTFAFDPDYEHNGRIYTIHVEGPARPGATEPTNASLPGLDLTGYVTTSSIDPPSGTVVRHSVLVEWTDTDLTNVAFEGTAREILRIGFNFGNHSVGDILFNPTATAADADYGNLYMAVGDGGAGFVDGETHSMPQRLDALPGKILRITPDTTLRPADALSANGRYRIPTTGVDPNPFISADLAGLRTEIFAYGFRNPQRMSWDSVSNTVIVADIGLASWEELNILRKGANYGYAEREGSEQLWIGGPNHKKTGSQAVPPTPFPDPDTLSVEGIATPVVPRYPVAAYSHRDGDAIAGGFVYRGVRLPELHGKYIFGDISTGRLFYADLAEMVADDDDNPASLATIRELQVLFNSPYDEPDGGLEITRLFDIVAAENTARGGKRSSGAVLPGAADHLSDGLDGDGIAYGGGRADIRFALDRDGELYVLSKSDAMIRAFSTSFSQPASVPDNFSITVSITGAGSGDVTSAPLGLKCPGVCVASFRAGTTVTLIPKAQPLSSFSGWSGACSGASACAVTLNAAASVTATFVVESAPDLTAAVTSIPATAVPGGRITLWETTTNNGGAAATVSSTTRYYLSPDGAKSAGDTVLGDRSVATLNPGASSTLNPSVTVPLMTALGSYYVIACADDTARVPEREEQNNCGTSETILSVTRPDLITTALSNPPAAIAPGASFTATDIVLNQGGYASNAATTRYYLSPDATKSATDRLLTGSRSVPSLEPNGSSTAERTVTVPAATTLGTYLVLACADDLVKVAELDESNNCAASSTTVLVGRPDLTTSHVSNPPAEIAPGKTFSVTATTLNQGDAAAVSSTMRYYLSVDDNRDASDVLLTGSRAVASLAPGATSAGARTVTVPPSVAAGAYRVLACSDDLVVVNEHNETNNCASALTPVQVRLPDLVQLAVSDPPAEVAAGTSFTVTDSVRNGGAIATTTTSTRYYFSTDAMKNTDDVLLSGTRGISSLAIGATSTGSRSVTAPPNLVAGTYYLLACADDTNAAVESREDNNCIVSATLTTVR
jgi:subtilase family serine protease